VATYIRVLELALREAGAREAVLQRAVQVGSCVSWRVCMGPRTSAVVMNYP
jgi:hypothetical protein